MYEYDQTIPHRFREIVQKFPHHIALSSKNHHLSYDELDKRSNHLATSLLDLLEKKNAHTNNTPNTKTAENAENQKTIAISAAHDIPLIIAILAILKTGKAYVPLDKDYPIELLKYMLENANSPLLLTDKATFPKTEKLTDGKKGRQIDVFHLHQLLRPTAGFQFETQTESAAIPRISPKTPAYIIYTSGSMGTPKGVLHNHRNVMRAAAVHAKGLALAPEDRVTLLASCSFSMSVMDIFSTLLTGATLCLYDLKGEGIPGLIQWLQREQITVYHSIPTVFANLLGSLSGQKKHPTFSHLRILKLGGERVNRRHLELFRRHFPHDCLFLNGYGLSEILAVTQYFLEPDKIITDSAIPIGFPTEGLEISFETEKGQKARPGEIGEMIIKSHYLTQGYWKQPQLTAKGFYMPKKANGPRFFRTGDIGYQTADGCITLVGRKDSQVKVHGVRVELDEVENILLSHDKIKEALVTTLDEQGLNTGLSALLVPFAQDGRINDGVNVNPLTLPSKTELRLFLEEKLSQRLIPSQFSWVQALPRTVTGKIDRRGILPAARLLPKWKPSEVGTPISCTGTTARLSKKKRKWLIFMDETGIGTLLANQLRENGQLVITVNHGQQFHRHFQDHFSLNRTKADDYQRLFKEIVSDREALPDVIIHLATLRRKLDLRTMGTPLSDGLEKGFYSLMNIVKALVRTSYIHKCQLEVVTGPIFNISGFEALQRELAVILGPCKTIPREFPNISCRCIDIDISPMNPRETAAAADYLIKEFSIPPPPTLVGYRKGKGFRLNLEPLPRAQQDALPESGGLREKGVYLITGGLGGMGLQFAAFLAKKVKAKLVLLDRFLLPPRSQWQKQAEVTEGEKDFPKNRVSRTIELLLKMEQSGSEVLPLHANVNDKEALETAFAQIKNRFGQLNGVIHAAGSVRGGSILLKKRDDMRPVLSPKITGMLNLEQAIKGFFRSLEKTVPKDLDGQEKNGLEKDEHQKEGKTEGLDFLLLCSSVTALTGGIGLADYTAANCFLDAYAWSRPRGPLGKVISINWDTWEKTGMSVRRSQARGEALQPQEALGMIPHILNLDSPQVIILRHGERNRLAEAGFFGSGSVSPGHPLAGPAAAPKSLQNENDSAPGDSMELMLVNTWEKFLKVPHIGTTDNFFQLGGNSIKASGIFAEVKEALGLHVPLETVFKFPTVKELASILSRKNGADSWRKDWEFLVPVRSNGSQKPFFCVHNMAGQIWQIVRLRRHLPENLPFYALQARGVNRNSAPLDRVEEMAGLYLREVREVQSESPYFLAGRCFGGLVAFEMAQQLAASGQETPLLVIFDCLPPRLKGRRKEIVKQGLTAAAVPGEAGPASIVRAHHKARFSYESAPFAGKVVLFTCRDNAETVPPAWKKFGQKDLATHVIECSHEEMIGFAFCRLRAPVFGFRYFFEA